VLLAFHDHHKSQQHLRAKAWTLPSSFFIPTVYQLISLP